MACPEYLPIDLASSLRLSARISSQVLFQLSDKEANSTIYDLKPKFRMYNRGNPDRGFTLAELLIALSILGVIATFTIPKILSAQTNGTYNARAKEVASMVSGAFQQYTLQKQLSASTKMEDLTPYMNYVARDTSSDVDVQYNASPATLNCSTRLCLRLHNGAMLHCTSNATFTGTASTDFIQFSVDPDTAVLESTTNGPGKSVGFALYTTGKLTDKDSATGGNNNPPWFSW